MKLYSWEKKELKEKIKALKAERKQYITEVQNYCAERGITIDLSEYRKMKISLRNPRETARALEDGNMRLCLIVPSLFPIETIMKKCEAAVWHGFGRSERIFESLDGTVRLKFTGTVYEPIYEYFETGCCVYYQVSGVDKMQPLYTIGSKNVGPEKNIAVEEGSIADVKKFILEHDSGFKEI